MNKSLKQVVQFEGWPVLLLPFFFVFHTYSENIKLLPLWIAGKLLAYFLIIAFILYVLFSLIFKSQRKASVFTFLILLINLFFGPAHDALKQVFGTWWITHYSFLLPMLVLLFIVCFFYLKKSKRTFSRLTRYLNLSLLILIVFDFSNILLSGFFVQQSITKESSVKTNSLERRYQPDIYLIIADEYAGDAALSSLFNYNNSSFETALSERGFHLIKGSSANYNFTPFSMASLLSMNYLKGIKGYNSNKEDRMICNHLIANNDVINFFKKAGYEIINNSVFTVEEQLPKVRSFAFSQTGEELITYQTLPGRLERDIRFHLISSLGLKSEIKRFTQLQKNGVQELYKATMNEVLKKHDKPTFIYTHLMMPHYPYFFDENGRPNPPDSLLEGNQSSKRMYLGYLKYCNSEFLKLIDHILTKSPHPPIIMFMGDHGFRHTETSSRMNYFSNLNSIFLPDRRYLGFKDSLTLVNQFRVLLNTEFGQHLPLLPDQHHYIQD